MKFRFFKGDITQEPLKTISDDWYKSREERDEKLNQIFATIPFYDCWYGGETSIYGIACNDDNPALEAVKSDKGYKLEKKEDKWIITPDKRYKSGKELNKKLETIWEILQSSPDFSKFSLKKLKMTCWVGFMDRLYIAVAGVYGDTFIAKIPVKTEGCDCDDFPKVAECLTEIKESEFLAIQGK
ncbi:DUF5420 family protein [Mannheimia haemolytica]|uniref:DUF5420 family protein n=1 Tax=Mannheimia haemolytica TaxID=75985 RepID=UPI00320A1CEF